MNTYNAGQLATIIRTLGANDIEELGADPDTQNGNIFQLMNIALWKLARLAYLVEFSDPLAITADGTVTFLKGSTPITNLFEPLEMLTVVNGVETGEVTKRTSYLYPSGWWRESTNQPIHMRGMSGNTVTLKYLRLPKQVTLATDPIELPESGYFSLIFDVLSLIKQPKNYYQESEAMAKLAKEGYGEIVQAAISGRGPSSGGQPPSYMDADKAKGG